MFEHSIYEPEPVATPLHEGDLFYQYEVNTWVPGPHVYRILGISALAHIVALVIIAQTSLLTMKGCDSPLVGRFCQVLDTVYVGSMVFGTDREYVDAAYDTSRIGENEEVTFVDVTGETPPLSYPEGYFQIANPQQFAMQQAMLQNPDGSFSQSFPGIPMTTPSTGGSILDTPPVLPPSSGSVIQGDLPSFNSPGPTTIPGVKNRPGRPGKPSNTVPDVNDMAATKPSPSPSPSGSPAPTPLSSDAVTSVEINKKPLVDFADALSTQWDAKMVNLDQPFLVVLNGVLTDDGKLDKQKSKYDPKLQKGDVAMQNVAKAALEALGESGYLTYLKSLGVDKITATVGQDDKQIMVSIVATQNTPERANSIASGLSGYILIGKTVVKNPSDERTLLDGAKVTTDGKNMVLNFTMEKPVAQEMITRKLRESQAKKADQAKPSGENNVRSSNNSAQN